MYAVSPDQINRVVVGNMIRKIGGRYLMENWPAVIVLAAASDIMAFLPDQRYLVSGSPCAQRVDFNNLNDRFSNVKDSGKLIIKDKTTHRIHYSKNPHSMAIYFFSGVVEETLQKYTRFMQYVVNEDMQRVFEWRPLLNVNILFCSNVLHQKNVVNSSFLHRGKRLLKFSTLSLARTWEKSWKS